MLYRIACLIPYAAFVSALHSPVHDGVSESPVHDQVVEKAAFESEAPQEDDTDFDEAVQNSTDLEEVQATSNKSNGQSTAENCGVRSVWSGVDHGFETGSPTVKHWQSLKGPKPFGKRPAKIGIIMMIYKRISFARTWQAILEPETKKNTTGFALVIHSKLPPEVPGFFKKYLLGRTLPNGYCKNAQLITQLLGIMLYKHTDVSHLMMVSGDALPLRPLSGMLDMLKNDQQSHFCTDEAWARAETWFMMYRDHASFLADHSTELGDLMSHAVRKSIGAQVCEDEDSFYWPLKLRNTKIAADCKMMTDWSGTAKHWRINAEKCRCPAFLNSIKDAATWNCQRPALFHDVSSKALDEVSGSKAGYFFVRKFPGDAVDGVATSDGKPLDDVMSARLSKSK